MLCVSRYMAFLDVSDDILIYGKTQEDHDESLRQVLQRLCEKGLTLNRPKCIFNKEHLKYLGYIFSKEGMSPDPDKVAALNMAEPPANATEVRSLLGMTNYCARFIHDYATITEPLRNLTKKDVEWTWGQREQEAFDELKRSLREDTVTRYYNPKIPTVIYVDASPVGLGAILVQDDAVVCFASRALTPVEQRYSQTDREALGVVFGCEKYILYVLGKPFVVITDHKPLTGIFNKPQSDPPARIEKWMLRLQRYDMNVTARTLDIPCFVKSCNDSLYMPLHSLYINFACYSKARKVALSTDFTGTSKVSNGSLY